MSRKKYVLPSAAISNDISIPWGGFKIPLSGMDTHYAIAGMTGSGKTLTFNMLMKAILPKVDGAQVSPATRSFIYDPKREVYGLLLSMGIPKDSIAILNPFDVRCSAWDIAADVQDRATSRQIADIFCPKEEDTSHPFFSLAAQALLFGVIEGFRAVDHFSRKQNRTEYLKKPWNLRDLVEACSNLKNLTKILKLTPTGNDLIETYITEHKTTVDILATLRANIDRLDVAASLWEHATEPPFSFKRWLNDASNDRPIVVVAADSANQQSLDPIVRAIFRRASELVTSRNELSAKEQHSRENQIWFFLDELRIAGKLTGLEGLLLEGRGRGAHVVIGFQDIEGLYKVYGQHVAREIVSQCGNKAILRISNVETMRWAANLVGGRRYWTQNRRDLDNLDSLSQARIEELQILPARFRKLLRPVKDVSGMQGVFFPPHTIDEEEEIEPIEVDQDWITNHLPRENRAVSGFLPHGHGLPPEEAAHRWAEVQEREPWDANDEKRFQVYVQRGHVRIPWMPPNP